jgi:hypothetical protein
MTGLNRSPTFRYPEVGRCIYCGRDDRPLSDEHPIPLALGGHLVLPKASCAACALRTHAYEYTTCRTTLGNLRMRFGFPTRRKKDRPTHIQIGTRDAQGRTGRIKVPVTEYPVGAFIPSFGRAGIFIGSSPELDTLQHLPNAHPTDDLNEFRRKYNWDGRVTIRWMPVEYGQAIIKMSYCCAVAELGFGTFRPLCLPQILSENKNISYIFGQNGTNPVVKGMSKLWEIELFYYTHQGRLLLMAHCSLLPGMGTPIYEVIVGDVQSPEHIMFFNKQLANNRLEIVSRVVV